MRTAGAGKSQPTEVYADQPHYSGHDGHGSPIGDVDSTVCDVDGKAEVNSIDVYSCARIVDEVADAGQSSQFGIKLDCSINIINYVTNAHYSHRGFLRWFI